MNESRFKHKHQVRVRNFEVDRQGIVHNALYLQYFEIGRIEYLRNLGISVDMNSIQTDSRVVVVRNEINYRNSARFDDALDVLTRIQYIRNKSFAFEAELRMTGSGILVADNISVHAWLDPSGKASIRVPEHFRSTVGKFEGNSVFVE